MAFRQTAALIGWNLRGLGRRARSVSVVSIGFFAVVLVFATVLSVRDGLQRSSLRPGTEDIAVVTGGQKLEAATLHIIEQMPGIAQVDGQPMVAGTLFNAMLLPNRKPDTIDLAVVLGIDSAHLGVLPGFLLTDGRMYRSGLNEMIIGEGAMRLFPEYAVGRTIRWQNRDWQIVGTYSTGSSTHDSQFIADLRQLGDVLNQSGRISGVYVRLSSPAAFEGFRNALERQPGLSLTIERLSEADGNLGRDFRAVLTLADGVITLLMAVGAIFAALNVMYASVAARSGELAILRALGFARFPILAAIMSEAMILALIGGTLAIATVALVFGNIETSTIMGSRLVSFRLTLTPSAVGIALALTLGMGFIGGLFPAIRAAFLPIANTLREG